MWILLLMPFLAHAAWPVSFEIALEETPRAVAFDAGRRALLVALDDGKGNAHVDQYSLAGKLEKKGLVKASGTAGPLRTYGEKIFWLVSNRLVDETAKPLEFYGDDVTVMRGGNPATAGAKGLMGLAAQGPDLKNATGIYQKNDAFFVLHDGDQLSEAGKIGQQKICPKDCRWLEINSKGEWLTVGGNEIFRAGKAWLKLPSAPGRPAYIFRKETKEDFIVVPFPAEKKVRAYGPEVKDHA
jgi:hypothetical protein